MDLKIWRKFCYVSFLFVVAGIAPSQCDDCAPGLSLIGYTDPHGDILIEYGQSLNITCVLTKKIAPNASLLLSFTRNNSTIPPEFITVLNSTAINLYIKNPQKVVSDSYMCLMSNETVCMNVVSVGSTCLF
jgi:hypothetical protein